MKNRTLLILSLGFGLAATSLPAQQVEVNKNNRTIAVITTETAIADANTANVHIGFQVFAPDEKTAYALGSRTSNAIIDALKKSGIPADAIQSENQTIARVQPFELQNLPEAQKPERQFPVTQSWAVKSSAKSASSVLDTAVQAGANQSGQIEWSVADENALEAQAAGAALKRAQEIAQQMASGLGARVGPLVYASNQAPERPMPVFKSSQLALMATPAQTPPPPLSISPQKVIRSATVYAIFSIE